MNEKGGDEDEARKCARGAKAAAAAPLSVSECHFDLFINIPMYIKLRSSRPSGSLIAFDQRASAPPSSTFFFLIVYIMFSGGFRSVSCQLSASRIYTYSRAKSHERFKSLSVFVSVPWCARLAATRLQGHLLKHRATSAAVAAEKRKSRRRRRERESRAASRLKRKTNEESLAREESARGSVYNGAGVSCPHPSLSLSPSVCAHFLSWLPLLLSDVHLCWKK